MYPSRSELIRYAVRSFLIKELESLEEFKKYKSKTNENIRIRIQDQESNNTKIKEISEDNIVQLFNEGTSSFELVEEPDLEKEIK